LLGLLLVGTVARAQTSWPSERPPRPLPAREVNFPPYQIRTLSNGLKVVAVLHHEQPAVSMRLIVRVGSASDPPGKLGLAHQLASLLDQGTETKSAGEFADAIDFIGGEVSAGAATDLTYINAVVMKDSFSTGLRMLSDVARRPAFAQAEIERQRQQTVSSLQVSLDDPEFVADAVFDRLVYGFHPYGMPPTGTPQTLEGITRDDLVAFHRKYFVPNNAILAIVGDVAADEAFEGAERVFADWDRKPLVAEQPAKPPAPMRQLVVVNKPDAVQTEVRVGHLGIPRKHPDYLALSLAVRILGGEGSNRLHNVLRTKRGLTYGAQAEMDALKDSGDLEARTNTRSETTVEVLRLIFEEFLRLQRDPVGERELADAKAYLTGSFPLTIETPDAIALQVLNVLFYDLPIEELQTFRDRVNAVTTADIERVAKAFLKPDRLSVVLVGNASVFASDLKSLGFSTVETVELGNLDLTTADFNRRPPREGAAVLPRSRTSFAREFATQAGRSVPAVTEEDLAARKLLAAVIEAKGGLDALRSVRNIQVVTKTTMVSPEGRAEAEATTYLEYPNRVRVETTFQGVASVQVFDGEHAFVRDPSGVHDIPERPTRDLQVSLRRDTISLLLAAEGGALRVRRLPDSKAEAGPTYQALEVSAADLDPVVLYVDPETHLIARQTYTLGRGQPVIEERFSDYRSVGGVQFAFVASVRRGGQTILERHLSDIRTNISLDPALFRRPAP
jgi:zinc protease